MIEHRSFFSKGLGGRSTYTVYLPHSVAASDPAVPVLYLLHGLFGSSANWLELTDIFDSGFSSRLVIVMPDAGDNWYTDRDGAGYETLISDDLIRDVEGSIDLERERIIAGISMGGYGAFKIALRHPDRYVRAAAFSGAFIVPRIEKHTSSDWHELLPSIENVFHSMPESELGRNDIFGLIKNVDAHMHLPDFYFDCGIDDAFIGVNRELDKMMDRSEIPHRFVERPGGHDWNYWTETVHEYLIEA